MILLDQGEVASRGSSEIDGLIRRSEALLSASEGRETPIGIFTACLTLGGGFLGALLGDFFSVQPVLPFVGGAAAGLATGTTLLLRNAAISKQAENLITEFKEVRANAIGESAADKAVEA